MKSHMKKIALEARTAEFVQKNAAHLFSHTIEIISYPHARAVCAAVAKRNADHGIVLLEEGATGTQHEAYDAIINNRCSIIGDRQMSTRGHYMRYGVIGRAQGTKTVYMGNKVSIVVRLPHVPGSLSRFLVQCSGRGLNLTKVESWPVAGTLGAYQFFIDFEHSFAPEVLKRVMKLLGQEATSFTLLGIYHAGRVV